MALKNDSNPYVTRMLGLVLNKDKLASEEQMKIAHMICDGNSITSNETREKACLVLGLAIQNDQQISINVISFLNRFSFQQSNQFGYRLQEYVLCANAAWNSNYFLTKRTFDNLHWLIEETNNVHIQNWIMWAYATRVKYDAPSNLQQTKITLLEKMLSQNHVSWSVSYIIRKMTEHDDKQTEQVSEKIWNLLTEIIDCDNYDVGTYRNAYCALGNFFSSKYTTQVSSDCKQRVVDSLGKAIVAENLSKDILNNAVRALKHMIIDGYTINARISTKLKELIQDDNHSLNEDAKVILDMVNNNTDKQHTTDMPKKHYSHVTLEKIAASRTMTIDQSQESTIEPQVTFINLEMVTNMQDHRMNSNECDADMEYEPHVSTRGDHLSFFRDTVNEVKNLLRLTKQFKFLTKVDINYLCKKFSDHEKHYFSVMERHEVYQLIASAFQNSTKNGQHQSKVVMELLIHRLTDPESPLELVLTCSETFSEIVKHKQSIPPHILEKLADILLKIDDSAVRKNILNVLAINVEKTIHDINIPLETLENDLTQPNTCLATSYIFLRAVLTEDKKISLSTFQLMCNIVSWPLQEGYSIDGRRNCMATIAYSIKKMDMRESQVQTIQFCLTKAFEDHDEKIRSLALKTLCFYCEVECITHFQPRILNENLYRILTKEIENQFSEDLRNITSIYLQAAKKKRQLTNDVLTTISVLLKISPDFNIRQNAIWTLKYVTEKLDTILLPLAVLVNVEIALDDPELSIRTVAVDIFLKNWRKGHLYLFKKSQASITKLLTNKFHINVQKSTLSILQEIIEKKHELSNDLIYLIAQFLFNPDLTMVTTAADILLSHVRNHTLSQNIINMVERTFHNRTNQNTLIKILRKCAFNQCILTEKTLLILGDLLFESNEEITRNIILSTLDFADRNQPLPEIINDLLRCEYYTKVLKNFESQTELEYAEQQLIAITSNGRRLSKGVLNSLQEFLANSELQSAILQIIVNITSNRQNLNNDMMNILTNLIFSTTSTTQVYVIKIFLNLVMNNQTPPNTFLNYLKNFILDTSVNTDVLLIYIILLERNMNSLDVDAISRIYKLLGNINELNLELNRNIAILLKQAIENGITSAEPELLIALLDSKDLLIQNNAIQMIHYMVKTNGCTLSDNMLSHLNQISMDEKVLEILENVSQTQQLPAHITERLDLVHCRDMHQDINLLKKLESAVSRGQLLLKHHFSELSNLLYSSNKVERMLASKILKIAALSNQTIPNQVIEVVATTTLDESMHPNTLQLLDKAFQCGWRASERTIEDLINLVTQSSTNVDMKEIARNILRKQNIVDFLIIEEYLSEISTSENKQVENLIGNLKIKIPVDKFSILYDKLMKQPSIRTESRILKVFQCAVYNNQSLSDDLLCCISDGLFRENKEIIVIILNKVMENGQVLPENVVHIVENAFLHDTTNSILHLISKLAYQYTLFQDDTIQLLIDKTKTYSDVSSIIEIIAEYQQLPLNIIRAYLEENLSNDDILKVRSSFIVLQHQIMKYYTEELFYLLTKVMLPHVVDENKLAAEISSIDEYLSIVRSLLSIEYFQADVFKMYPVKQWPRECLCIDLLARMKMEKNQLEVFTFYHNLSKLEEVNGYELYDEERDHILQLLIEKHAEMDMNKINQILILLQDVSIDILEFNSPNWYTNLIKSYVQKQIVKHFPEFGSTHAAANHINNLLLDIYSNYQSVEILTSILHSCSQPDQLITFLHLISNHQITSKEMNDALLLSTRTKTTLNKQLEMKIISKNLVKIWSGPADLLRQADDLLRKLFINWSFDNLSTILHNIQNTSKSLEQFIQYLTIINNYRIDDKLVEEIIHIFTIQQSDECIDEIYKLAINHCFPTTNTIEKSIQELIEEISELNRNNQIVSNFINENKLQDTFQTIQSVLLKESSLINITLPIDKWNESNIKEWSKQVQLNSNWAKQWENLSEIIAVIQRAIYLDSNYKIRHIQLMAVLLLLNSNDESRGRLAQIATGEGKSTIISILAIVKALQGLHVDIVTSSTILAQRDAKEKAKLYSMFNLSVSHNGDDDTVYTSGSKKCYTSSIVYGDVSHFQFDVLRDEFSLLNTRAKRPFSVVIIDEVDSMLIDENNKIARLADYMLGMEYLNPLLYGIWQAIKNLTDDEVVCKNTLVNKIKSVILGENPQITVPQHLRPFVLSQLSLWIENAFVARYRYELERHYTIKPDEQNINRITPIDYLNTGVIQSSTTWSDGLHQFLQLKHGLKLTPLNLTTNFLSNVGFFD